MATQIQLPGEPVPSTSLPTPKTSSGTLTLGPGLLHTPPSTITTTTAGTLQTDAKKAATWLESASTTRYQPSVGDLVIAQIHHSSTDLYHCALTPHTPFALLGQLSFENASRKTRPQLKSGDLVYARVKTAGKRGEEVEVECVNSATGKAEGMGPLKGGMVWEVSPGFARRLMLGGKRGGVVVLEAVGDKCRFEVAVGRNGRVWVDAGSVAEVLGIGRLLVMCDEEGWGVEEQKKRVKGFLKGF
ncbi:hypothetical protein MBLNU230_g6748t1 [Neophaeotheca triangularis]